jgi:hypothetical protein
LASVGVRGDYRLGGARGVSERLLRQPCLIAAAPEVGANIHTSTKSEEYRWR